MATLMLAVFTVSVGFGIALPLLPDLIERLLGVFVTRFAADFFSLAMPAGSVAVPLAATVLLAFLVSLAVAFTVPGRQGSDRSKQASITSVDKTAPPRIR